MKYILSLAFSLLCLSGWAQSDSLQLLKPTGTFAIGRMVYEWTDTSREIQITEHCSEKRTLVVQLWYPAHLDSPQVKAAYAPYSKEQQHISTHSYLRAAFSEQVSSAPLILISPGRGTKGARYSTIAEELASHGYIVAAVDMPQIGHVQYADGWAIRPSSDFAPPRGLMGGPYEKVDQFFEKPTAIGLADLQFAYQQLSALNESDPHGRFIDRIDLKKLGLLGHSLGGRIAGQFAAEHPHVKAYISMEGIPPRDIRYKGKLKIPVAMMCSSGTWPYAKDNYFSLIDHRTKPVYMIEMKGFGHNSVLDSPYLYPDDYSYSIDPEKGLKISRQIILTYFEAMFNQQDNWQEALQQTEAITFRQYP